MRSQVFDWMVSKP